MGRTVTYENEKSLTAPLSCQQHTLITSAPLNQPSVYLLCTAPGYKCSGTQLWKLDVAAQAVSPSQCVDSADAAVYKAANNSHQHPRVP